MNFRYNYDAATQSFDYHGKDIHGKAVTNQQYLSSDEAWLNKRVNEICTYSRL